MVLPLPEANASADPVCPAVEAHCKLSVGARWRGFHVEGLVPGASGTVFEATNIGQMEKVLIVAAPVTAATEWRKGTWQKLSANLPPEARILRCIETFAEDGWRYEVMNRPPPTTLREWMSSHQADGATHRSLLEQLTTALGALHAEGIVHLNLRPETIYVEEKDGGLEIVVGGLDVATLYNHSNLVVSDVDPFYAPPEAVDPAGLRPGIGLCAWDWWTVGRVIQELVLGRHVMSVLFGKDVIRQPTPQLRAQAEALLLEREPPGLRAGAVEAMTGIDAGMETMLRGLLTTARDARWSAEAVRRWDAKESVNHHYELPRDARFYSWKGRGMAVPDAIEYFCREENWADGEENLCDPQNPDTLANFVSTVPKHQSEWQKLQRALAALESPEWIAFPAPARRTVTTALSWLVLGPQPRGLILRGQVVDAAGLAVLLGDNQNFYNCANVEGLMAPACLALIKSFDAAAAEILGQLAAVGQEALRLAVPARWVDAEDIGGKAELLRLALEPEATLRKRSDRVRATYATSRDPGLAQLLADPSPSAWGNVLLVLTAADPRRFGYVTRAEHARQQLAGLQTRSQQMRLAAFWLRLQQMLLAGGPCTGRWQVFVAWWFALVAVGLVLARDVTTTFGLAVGLVGLRLLISWRVGALARRRDPAAPPWNWRDGPRRCAKEAQRVWPEASRDKLAGLTRHLAALEGEMANLAPGDPSLAPQKNPLMAGLWLGLAAGTLLCVLAAIRLMVNSGHAIQGGIASYSQPAEMANPPEQNPGAPAAPGKAPKMLASMPGLSKEMSGKVARGEYEIIDDGFGPTLHGPITKWDLAPSGTPAPLPVESRVRATSSQRAYALVSAELLLQPYPRKGVNALLIVRVPAGKKIGVMVYNARDRLLVDNDTLVIREQLSARTWFKFENRNVVYLGTPPEIKKENSLALR